MVFARHNIEKRRLIDLVRQNPILWDCRLPHYKRSDKKKANKWGELGRLFGVNGARVQRTFTSLRETFRRELNQEKLLDARFKSKWVYYDAMSFLKEVIRERKSRERPRANELHQIQTQASAPHLPHLPQPTPSQSGQLLHTNTTNNNNNNNNSIAKKGIDEYQYFAPNDPNNPSNQHQQQQQHKQLQQALQQHQQQLPHDVVLSLSALSTLQKLSTSNCLNVPPHPIQNTQLPQPTSQALETPPLVALSTTTSRSASSTPSFYIKDEPDSQDDIISLATTIRHDDKWNGDGDGDGDTRPPVMVATAQQSSSTHSARMTPQQRPAAATVTSAPPPLSSASLPAQVARDPDTVGGGGRASRMRAVRTNSHLVIDEAVALNDVADDNPDPDVDADADGDDADNDGDDYAVMDDGLFSIDSSLSKQSLHGRCLHRSHHSHGQKHIVEHRPSPREILYTKFGDFLAVRLNTLQETVANELMNKILMMIAEK